MTVSKQHCIPPGSGNCGRRARAPQCLRGTHATSQNYGKEENENYMFYLFNSHHNLTGDIFPIFIVIEYTYKIYHANHFYVYILVVLSTFTLLCNHPSPELLLSCKTEYLSPFSNNSPLSPLSSPWQLPFYFLSL